MNANGVFLKTKVKRDGNWLKADVYLVVAGEVKVFTVGVDVAKITRAIHAYHANQLHSPDGAVVSGAWGSLTNFTKKIVKKTVKNKLVKSIANTAKSVIKSKITGAAVASVAVAFPPVGVPAAAAYASANAAVAAIERADAIRRTARSIASKAKKAVGKGKGKGKGKNVFKLSTAAKKKIALALKQEKKAKATIKNIQETAKFSSDQKKRDAAARALRTIQITAASRTAMRAKKAANERRKAKQLGKKPVVKTAGNRVKGLVVDERGRVYKGTFDSYPLGKNAALLYGPKKSIPGSYVKVSGEQVIVGGCVGCEPCVGCTSPWPNLRG